MAEPRSFGKGIREVVARVTGKQNVRSEPIGVLQERNHLPQSLITETDLARDTRISGFVETIKTDYREVPFESPRVKALVDVVNLLELSTEFEDQESGELSAFDIGFGLAYDRVVVAQRDNREYGLALRRLLKITDEAIGKDKDLIDKRQDAFTEQLADFVERKYYTDPDHTPETQEVFSDPVAVVDIQEGIAQAEQDQTVPAFWKAGNVPQIDSI